MNTKHVNDCSYDEATLKLEQAETIIRTLMHNEMVDGDAFNLVYIVDGLLCNAREKFRVFRETEVTTINTKNIVNKS